MKPGKITHTIAVILSSISSLFAHGTGEKAEPAKTKFSKKSDKSEDDRSSGATSISFIPGQLFKAQSETAHRYSWKSNIVTTVFWIGEQASGNNLVPNRTSSWDKQWTKNYGGFERPESIRVAAITCRWNSHPNRIHSTALFPITIRRGRAIDRKRRASFPGFKAYQGPATSTCKDRMDRHSQRQPYGLCAMGRRRPVPYGSLAIRVRQRTT